MPHRARTKIAPAKVVGAHSGDLLCRTCRRILIADYRQLIQVPLPAIQVTCMPCGQCGDRNDLPTI